MFVISNENYWRGVMPRCCSNCYMYDECENRNECCSECDYYSGGECLYSEVEPYEELEGG